MKKTKRKKKNRLSVKQYLAYARTKKAQREAGFNI